VHLLEPRNFVGDVDIRKTYTCVLEFLLATYVRTIVYVKSAANAMNK